MKRYVMSEELKNEICKEWDNQHMRDYCIKEVSNELKLTSMNGFIVFIKQRINTSFCFGYYDYDASTVEPTVNAAKEMSSNVEEFIRKNLAKFDDELKLYTSNEKLYLCPRRYDCCSNIYNITTDDECYLNNQYEKLVEINKEDRQNLIEKTKEEKAKFVKRLNAYLKRFGLSKVHSWTYIID